MITPDKLLQVISILAIDELGQRWMDTSKLLDDLSGHKIHVGIHDTHIS
jgi:hypothetical protein